MNPTLLAAFQKKYEALSGVVHVAADIPAALTAIAGVLQQTKAAQVACADLPPELQAALETHCAGAGVELRHQPFVSHTLPDAIDQCQVGVSGAAFAVAPMGAFVEMTADDAVRLVSSLPRTHIAVIHADTILPELIDAAPHIERFYRQHPKNAAVTFVSGPSRTGDIEMRLTLGVHGPVASHVVILTNPDGAALFTAAGAVAGAHP